MYDQYLKERKEINEKYVKGTMKYGIGNSKSLTIKINWRIDCSK